MALNKCVISDAPLLTAFSPSDRSAIECPTSKKSIICFENKTDLISISTTQKVDHLNANDQKQNKLLPKQSTADFTSPLLC